MPVFAQIKEDIYLKHNVGAKEIVQYSLYRDGHDKKPIEFEQEFSMGNFIFGNQFFEIETDKLIVEVPKKDIEKLNVVTLDYFLRKREATKETQSANPNSLFGKIFILVPSNSGNYLRFEVKWKEMTF